MYHRTDVCRVLRVCLSPRLMLLARVQLTLGLLTSVSSCQRLHMAWRSHGTDNADMVRLLRGEVSHECKSLDVGRFNTY